MEILIRFVMFMDMHGSTLRCFADRSTYMLIVGQQAVSTADAYTRQSCFASCKHWHFLILSRPTSDNLEPLL